MTQERIPLAGVIGSPIAHSRSPQIHGHWLATMGLPGHYVPMDVRPDDLADVLRTLPRAGFKGVNITIPHKVSALDLADIVTDRARTMGAANTITFQEDGAIHADNTDGHGFIRNLQEAPCDWRPEAGSAAVLGAGGAARAVIAALLDEGVPEILLSNRTRARADALAQEFGPQVRVIDWDRAGDMLGEAATVVNTTSLGMQGHPPLEVPLGGLRPGTVVTDIVYAPLRTPLLEQAERLGCHTVDGLGMLLYQAVPGFERWFGACPKVDAATRAAALA